MKTMKAGLIVILVWLSFILRSRGEIMPKYKTEMNKILVIGVSAGVGKSTFSRKLGEKLKLAVYHLDCYFWNPGWKEASEEEFRARQIELVQHDRWIIEGNYRTTLDIRMPHADTIIYIELPRIVAMYRVLKRWRMYLGKDRPDRAAGCKEQMEWSFLKFIWTTYRARKKNFNKMLDQLKSEKNVIKLKSQSEIDEFLMKLNITKKKS
jgi:adenylate kinase family enzyme